MNLLRVSFFAHFCAGETADETKDTVARLNRSNVNAIMDYAAEADVELNAKSAAKLRDDLQHRKTGVISARTYEYSDESLCEANTDLILESIDNAAYAGGDQFVAMKLTAIAKPELLEKISSVLRAIKNLWINEFGSSVARLAVDRERFGKFIAAIGVSDDQRRGRPALLADRSQSRRQHRLHRVDASALHHVAADAPLLRADGYDLGLLTAVTRRGAPNYFTSLLPLLRGL
jgi:hypothetical protein